MPNTYTFKVNIWKSSSDRSYHEALPTISFSVSVRADSFDAAQPILEENVGHILGYYYQGPLWKEKLKHFEKECVLESVNIVGSNIKNNNEEENG